MAESSLTAQDLEIIKRKAKEFKIQRENKNNSQSNTTPQLTSQNLSDITQKAREFRAMREAKNQAPSIANPTSPSTIEQPVVNETPVSVKAPEITQPATTAESTEKSEIRTPTKFMDNPLRWAADLGIRTKSLLDGIKYTSANLINAKATLASRPGVTAKQVAQNMANPPRSLALPPLGQEGEDYTEQDELTRVAAQFSDQELAPFVQEFRTKFDAPFMTNEQVLKLLKQDDPEAYDRVLEVASKREHNRNNKMALDRVTDEAVRLAGAVATTDIEKEELRKLVGGQEGESWRQTLKRLGSLPNTDQKAAINAFQAVSNRAVAKYSDEYQHALAKLPEPPKEGEVGADAFQLGLNGGIGFRQWLPILAAHSLAVAAPVLAPALPVIDTGLAIKGAMDETMQSTAGVFRERLEHNNVDYIDATKVSYEHELPFLAATALTNKLENYITFTGTPLGNAVNKLIPGKGYLGGLVGMGADYLLNGVAEGIQEAAQEYYEQNSIKDNVTGKELADAFSGGLDTALKLGAIQMPLAHVTGAMANPKQTAQSVSQYAKGVAGDVKQTVNQIKDAFGTTFIDEAYGLSGKQETIAQARPLIEDIQSALHDKLGLGHLQANSQARIAVQRAVQLVDTGICDNVQEAMNVTLEDVYRNNGVRGHLDVENNGDTLQGKITFSNPKSLNPADVTTFAHESSHFYLDKVIEASDAGNKAARKMLHNFCDNANVSYNELAKELSENKKRNDGELNLNDIGGKDTALYKVQEFFAESNQLLLTNNESPVKSLSGAWSRVSDTIARTAPVPDNVELSSRTARVLGSTYNGGATPNYKQSYSRVVRNSERITQMRSELKNLVPEGLPDNLVPVLYDRAFVNDKKHDVDFKVPSSAVKRLDAFLEKEYGKIVNNPERIQDMRNELKKDLSRKFLNSLPDEFVPAAYEEMYFNELDHSVNYATPVDIQDRFNLFATQGIYVPSKTTAQTENLSTDSQTQNVTSSTQERTQEKPQPQRQQITEQDLGANFGALERGEKNHRPVLDATPEGIGTVEATDTIPSNPHKSNRLSAQAKTQTTQGPLNVKDTKVQKTTLSIDDDLNLDYGSLDTLLFSAKNESLANNGKGIENILVVFDTQENLDKITDENVIKLGPEFIESQYGKDEAIIKSDKLEELHSRLVDEANKILERNPNGVPKRPSGLSVADELMLNKAKKLNLRNGGMYLVKTTSEIKTANEGQNATKTVTRYEILPYKNNHGEARFTTRALRALDELINPENFVNHYQENFKPLLDVETGPDGKKHYYLPEGERGEQAFDRLYARGYQKYTNLFGKATNSVLETATQDPQLSLDYNKSKTTDGNDGNEGNVDGNDGNGNGNVNGGVDGDANGDVNGNKAETTTQKATEKATETSKTEQAQYDNIEKSEYGDYPADWDTITQDTEQPSQNAVEPKPTEQNTQYTSETKPNKAQYIGDTGIEKSKYGDYPADWDTVEEVQDTQESQSENEASKSGELEADVNTEIETTPETTPGTQTPTEQAEDTALPPLENPPLVAQLKNGRKYHTLQYNYKTPTLNGLIAEASKSDRPVKIGQTPLTLENSVINGKQYLEIRHVNDGKGYASDLTKLGVKDIKPANVSRYVIPLGLDGETVAKKLIEYGKMDIQPREFAPSSDPNITKNTFRDWNLEVPTEGEFRNWAIKLVDDTLKGKGHNLSASNLILDGKVHRFHIDGDKNGSFNGSYMFEGHDANKYLGWVMNFKDDSTFDFVGGKVTPNMQYFTTQWRNEHKQSGMLAPERTATPAKTAEQLEQERKAREAQAEAEAKKERQKRDKAAAQARAEYANGIVPTDNEYLKSKGFDYFPKGLKVDKQTGNLLVPLYNINGTQRGMQRIFPYEEGQKSRKGYFPDAEKGGTFIALDKDGTFGPLNKNLSESTNIAICEGVATGMSIRDMLNDSDTVVVCAMDAWNLETVAQAIHDKYPNNQISFYADNDFESTFGGSLNTGFANALRAARKLNLPDSAVISPTFVDVKDGTDWNDFVQKNGVQMAKQYLADLNKGPKLLGIKAVNNALDKTPLSLNDLTDSQTIQGMSHTRVFFEPKGNAESHSKESIVLDADKYIRETSKGKVLVNRGELRTDLRDKIAEIRKQKNLGARGLDQIANYYEMLRLLEHDSNGRIIGPMAKFALAYRQRAQSLAALPDWKTTGFDIDATGSFVTDFGFGSLKSTRDDFHYGKYLNREHAMYNGRRRIHNHVDMQLQDIYDAPDLYKAHPEMRNMEVIFTSMLNHGLTDAFYEPEKNRFYMPLKYLTKEKNGGYYYNGTKESKILLESFSHEIQHDLEGKSQTSLYGASGNNMVYEFYLSDAGEVKARQAEARALMSEKARALISIRDSDPEKIPFDKQHDFRNYESKFADFIVDPKNKNKVTFSDWTFISDASLQNIAKGLAELGIDKDSILFATGLKRTGYNKYEAASMGGKLDDSVRACSHKQKMSYNKKHENY